MYRYKHTFSLIAALLFAAGFVFSFWLISLLGLLLAAASGQYAIAVLLGLLMDMLYGSPIGFWHRAYVPFTLLSFLASGVHYSLSSYVRRRDTGIL